MNSLKFRLFRIFIQPLRENSAATGYIYHFHFCLENPKVVSDFHTVGTSIHSVSEAVEAEKLGASYLTAGHIYVTDCKKGLPPRGLPFLQHVCQAVQIPVYGIGGIKIDKAQLHELKNAGAAGGCVMSGMMHV